ncbi:hypothetical protein ACFLRT_04735, partial [Acidobacteriota bacterium]
KQIEGLLKDNAIDSPIRFFNIDVDDPRYEKYVELIQLMGIPGIEQIIFGKIEEIKERVQE